MEEMSGEDRAEMYDNWEEAMQEELGDDVEMIVGGPEGDEEWRELMPDKSRSSVSQILVYVVQIVIILAILSPAVLFVLVGFEAAMAAFMTMVLFFMVQIV